MSLSREPLYRFPWSQTDNPGGWIEVTDECDLDCPGCYRHRLEGHRSLNEIEKDIITLQETLNCDRIAIAGGEPLIYPDIIKVVDFISRRKMKPIMLTNGEKLTREFALELKKSGLKQFLFHVDSRQQRPGWENKSEGEMNGLRQKFADLLWELGGVQCGYNITIFPASLNSITDIIAWGRSNIHKVQHISLIAFRSILLQEGYVYEVNGKPIDTGKFQCSTLDPGQLSVTSAKMAEILMEHFPDVQPCAYLNGTTSFETFKFLIMLPIGSKKWIYGSLGRKTVELAQMSHHLVKGRYLAFQERTMLGKKVFLLGLFDRGVRKACSRFLARVLRNPLTLFERIYVQCINLQQPNETYNGRTNLCDGCLNLMPYKEHLIHSCQLDEYRLWGGPIQPRFKRS
jgi:hypothetical protein